VRWWTGDGYGPLTLSLVPGYFPYPILKQHAK
jgi:hypothetical protein